MEVSVTPSKIDPQRTKALVSRLPYWNVTYLPNGSKLGIQCPNCEGKALVSRRWSEPRTYKCSDGSMVLIIGRPCTYCFKTAQIPNRERSTT